MATWLENRWMWFDHQKGCCLWLIGFLLVKEYPQIPGVYIPCPMSFRQSWIYRWEFQFISLHWINETYLDWIDNDKWNISWNIVKYCGISQMYHYQSTKYREISESANLPMDYHYSMEKIANYSIYSERSANIYQWRVYTILHYCLCTQYTFCISLY